MEYGKSKLIRLLENTPREGWTNQKLKDLIDSLWRDPVLLRWSGFENAGGPDTLISWNATDKIFSIAPLIVTFGFYQYRVKLSFHKRAVIESINMSEILAEGRYIFFYTYNDELLKHVVSFIHNPTETQVNEIFLYKTEIANIYWDADAGEALHFGDDRHGSEWNPQIHRYLHTAFRARRKSGLTITGASFGGDGSENAHAKFSVIGGVMLHDDFELEIPSSSDSIPILYQQGFFPRYVYNSGYAIYKGAARACFNSGGAIIQADNGNYILYHIFATNEIGDASRKIISVMGSAEYTTLADAYTAAPAELDALNTWMPQQGRFHIDTIIVQTSDDFTNDAASIIVSIAAKTHPPVTIADNSKQLLEITGKQELSIIDAPVDGKTYGRKNKTWVEFVAGESGDSYLWKLSKGPEIVGYLTEPSNIQIQITGSGTVAETVPEGSFFLLTAINEYGETLAVPNPAFNIYENTPAFEDMVAGDFVVSWDSVAGATGYNFIMPMDVDLWGKIEVPANSVDVIVEIMDEMPQFINQLPPENTAAIYEEPIFDIQDQDIVKILASGIDVSVDVEEGLKTVTLTKQHSDWDETDEESPNFIANKPEVFGQQQSDWNQSDTEAVDYIKNKPTSFGEDNVQSDWNQSNTGADDFIKNKPTIPAAQVNADWNAGSGVAQILNKPVILQPPGSISPTSLNANDTVNLNHTHKLIPAGANTQIQVNVFGALSASSEFTYSSGQLMLNSPENNNVLVFKNSDTLKTALWHDSYTGDFDIDSYNNKNSIFSCNGWKRFVFSDLGNISDHFFQVKDMKTTPDTYSFTVFKPESWIAFAVKNNGDLVLFGTTFTGVEQGATGSAKLVSQSYVDDGDSSDKRLKKSVKPIGNALSFIKKLRGVSFKWKKTDKKSIGFIAQEFEKIIPELVTENPEGYKRIDYRKVSALLVEGIKQQQDEIELLKNEIREIKKHLNI